MIRITLTELLKVTSGKLLKENIMPQQEIQGVSIDSRTIQKGNLFVAIKGENHDGHKFIPQAIKKGASLVVAEKKCIDDLKNRNTPIVVAEDNKKVLYDLALWYRKKFDLPTIAITGSNGKTTTKEMASAVLSKRFKVLKSPKSYNNLIGIPLTLFEMSPETDILVLELGMSSPGEIAKLTKLTQPDWGVITNIGIAHLEFMKSLENIAKAKFELLDNMGNDKTSILNVDDKLLQERIGKEKGKVITFGIENNADYQTTSIQLNENGYPRFQVNNRTNLNLKLLGKYNIYNALVAFALGTKFGIDQESIKQSLEGYKPAKLRMEASRAKEINLINDAYNANPVSMRHALETLAQLQTPGRKIAVLGDMLELGEKSDKFHLKVGETVGQLDIDYLLLRGDFSKEVANGAKQKGMNSKKVEIFEQNKQISSWLFDNLKKGDAVLFKASRKMKFEEITEELTNLLDKQS